MYKVKNKKVKVFISEGFFSLLLLLSVAVISVFLSDSISEYVKNGLRLCFGSIIGSVFPFMILTDLFFSLSSFDKITPLRFIFERVFHINGQGISAFILGTLCGFPIGIKVARDLYLEGMISKDECERLISFTTNPSPAFTVTAVGVCMRSSFSDGVMLYVCSVLSSVFSGIILGIGKKPSISQRRSNTSAFNFTKSVATALSSTLTVCAFIVTFSVICGFASHISSPPLRIIAVSLLEVGNAAKYISESGISPSLSFAITSAALSFSGISVYLQGKSLLEHTDISMSKYLRFKLFTALTSFLLAFLSYNFIV